MLDRWVDPEDIGAAIALPAVRLIQGKGLGSLSAPIEGFASSVISRNVLEMGKIKIPEAKPVLAGVIVGTSRYLMGKGGFGNGFVDGVTANVLGDGVLSRASGIVAGPLSITRGYPSGGSWWPF